MLNVTSEEAVYVIKEQMAWSDPVVVWPPTRACALVPGFKEKVSGVPEGSEKVGRVRVF